MQEDYQSMKPLERNVSSISELKRFVTYKMKKNEISSLLGFYIRLKVCGIEMKTGRQALIDT